jgi:hypothetical protein
LRYSAQDQSLSRPAVSDFARYASSFIESHRLGNVGIALIRMTIDISDGLLGPVYNSNGRR